MNYDKLLSIIVPVYNCEKYLERCIISLVRQQFDANEYEIIFINDGSTDRSLDILKKYSQDYDNIRIIEQPNCGVSAARNVGIDNASGKYLAFVDADDMVYEKAYRYLTKQAEKRKADVILFNYKACDEHDGLDFFSDFDFSMPSCCQKSGKKIASTNVWREIIRSSIVKNNKLRFSPMISMGEDHYFNEQLMCFIDEVNIWYVNQPLYAYRQYTNSCSQNNSRETVVKKQNSMVQIAKECRAFAECRPLSKDDRNRLLERQYESVAAALVYSLYLGTANAKITKKVLMAEKLYPYKLTSNFLIKKEVLPNFFFCFADLVFFSN